MKLVLFWFIFFTTLFSCNNSNLVAQLVNNSPESSNLFYLDDLQGSDYNLLFIGNSLTYTNNLPELVKQNAKLKGISVGIKMIAKPNYGIVDHWAEGDVQSYIESEKFNYVIIQQGPSSQQEGRDMLIEGGKKYAELCNSNNAKLCYFMVWPSLTYYHTFEGVIKNHQDAAAINNAILCPVGEVWKTQFDTTNNFDYYSPDGFHPSLKGSQVAANIIVETLFLQ